MALRKTTKYIVVHCTENRPNCKMTMADFRRLHRAKGWVDVGYHYIVFEDGRVEEGRTIEQVGAHCRRGGHNNDSIGVAYVGGLDANGVTADTRTPAQKESLLTLLTALVRTYRATIVGHRDFDRSKVCPCFDAKNYNQLIAERIAEQNRRIASTPTTPPPAK